MLSRATFNNFSRKFISCMPRRVVKVTQKEKELARERKRLNKLASLKNELEAGRIKSFEQIFAIISETQLAAEVGISFYTFRKKQNNPGEFTITEMIRMAVLIGVEYTLLYSFLMELIRHRGRHRNKGPEAVVKDS
jgi:hypothetical protein